MKLKNLLFLSLAALGFAACSSDDSIKQGENNSEQEDAYVSFSLNLGSRAFSRAGDSTDTGTQEEQGVKSVRVVMYSDGKVEKAQDFAITSDGGSNIEGEIANAAGVVNSSSKFTTKGISVKRKSYQVAVILNATADIVEQTQAGSPFAALGKVLEDVTSSKFKDNGFVMSNAQDVVTLQVNHLKSTAQEAEASPLNVQVDRVLAKVGVSVSDNLGDNAEALVEARGWILDVKNKKTFLLRNLTLAQDGSFEKVDHVKTPADLSTPREQRYAKDPNFTAIDVSGKTYEERLEILEKHFDYYSDATFDEGNAIKTGFDYAIENTFDKGKENVLQSQATRVVLKAGYTPKNLGLVAQEDWVSYAGIPMTTTQFHENAKKALMLSWNETVAGLTPSFTNVIKNMVFLSAHIQGLEAKQENPDFVKKYKHLDVVTFTNLEALQAIITEAAAAVGSDEIANIKLTPEQLASIGVTFNVGGDSEPFSISELNYYKGGDNYYPLYIKHFTTPASDKNTYGKYGVVRNNFYKINVEAINRPGSPIITIPVGPGLPTVPTTPVDPENPEPEDPDPVDPEVPIDSEDIWVSYQVEILPWLVRNQNEIID